MDDDGNKSLSFREFKKGIHDYGLNMEDDVRLHQRVCAVCVCVGGGVSYHYFNLQASCRFSYETTPSLCIVVCP
jgi:hypothetical protein